MTSPNVPGVVTEDPDYDVPINVVAEYEGDDDTTVVETSPTPIDTPVLTIPLVGPQGPPGPQGPEGTPGRDVQRFVGDGPPGTIIGAHPDDEYLDRLTMTLYILK